MKKLTRYILEYCKYAKDKGMKISPLPRLQYTSEPQPEALQDQKTAYYDPEGRRVVIYTKDRNDKDMLRSFTHELVHHEQNLKGTISPEVQTDNTNESPKLDNLEKEAYLKGNISLRNFLDQLKNKNG